VLGAAGGGIDGDACGAGDGAGVVAESGDATAGVGLSTGAAGAGDGELGEGAGVGLLPGGVTDVSKVGALLDGPDAESLAGLAAVSAVVDCAKADDSGAKVNEMITIATTEFLTISDAIFTLRSGGNCNMWFYRCLEFWMVTLRMAEFSRVRCT
jgi:hypothetical protein